MPVSDPMASPPLAVRGRGARASCVVVWICVAFAAFAIVRADRGADVVLGLAICAAISLAMWMGAWNPAVVIEDGAVVVRNILREVRIPWPRLTAISAGLSLVLEADGTSYAAWAIAGKAPRGRMTRITTGRGLGLFAPRLGGPGGEPLDEFLPGPPAGHGRRGGRGDREPDAAAVLSAGEGLPKGTAAVIDGRWLARRDSGDASPVIVTRLWLPALALVGLVAVAVIAGAAA